MPELVLHRRHELGRLDRGEAVEVRHLVERAVDRALGRRAVVADDVVDERVLERADVLQRVDQAADVVVGVLQEPGVHLHLPLQHRLERVVHVVPRRDLHPAARSAPRPSGTTPRCFCRSKIDSRCASQPSANRPAYLSAHSGGTWCGACVAPGAKYMKNGLSGASAFWVRTQSMARSARSSVRW